MPKLMTPVGEPIKLDLVTPLHVVDADVVLLSGYRVDDERPPDEDPGPLGLPKEAGPGGKGGACTNALLQFLYESTPDDTWLSTIVGMHRFCRTHGYEQQPQLSVGNHRFNFRRNFSALHPRCRGNPRRAERRTKALLVGCNYLGSDVELEGAWNDVDKMPPLPRRGGWLPRPQGYPQSAARQRHGPRSDPREPREGVAMARQGRQARRFPLSALFRAHRRRSRGG